jgi:hypothetical protein
MGQHDLGVAEGGFGSYVKPYKPWFIGREAFVARENRKGVLVRLRFTEKGMRMAHNGDPVVDKRGKAIGLGQLLRCGRRRLPDRPGLPGPEVRRGGYTNLRVPIRAGEGRSRAGGDEAW